MEFTYDELLLRKFGSYEYHVDLTEIREISKTMNIHVDVVDDFGILEFEIPSILGSEDEVISFEKGSKRSFIKFSLGNKGKKKPDDSSVDAKVTVKYKIGEYEDGGVFCLSDDQQYFVHSFAPNVEDLDSLLPRALVFVIDVSGSMYGRKIIQTKNAFTGILNELSSRDVFTIITFSREVKVWENELLSATDGNKSEAIKFVSRLIASGSTNINDAVMEGMKILQKTENSSSSKYAGSLILLTDGRANSGSEIETDKIVDNVKKMNTKDKLFSVFTLGFGFDLDYDFLREMALGNNGFARRIWEHSDAQEQMEEFFAEIKAVLLSNIEIQYELFNPLVFIEDTSTTKFKNLYHGSELVITGRLSPNNNEEEKEKEEEEVNILKLNIIISALSSSGKIDRTIQKEVLVKPEEAFIPRTNKDVPRCNARLIYAMNKIDELLIDYFLSGKETKRKEALEIALEFSLVTDVTSMFVESSQKHESNNDYEGEHDKIRKQHINSQDSRWERFEPRIKFNNEKQYINIPDTISSISSATYSMKKKKKRRRRRRREEYS